MKYLAGDCKTGLVLTDVALLDTLHPPGQLAPAAAVGGALLAGVSVSPEVLHHRVAGLHLGLVGVRHGKVTGSLHQALALRDVVVHHGALDGVRDVVPPVTHGTIVLQSL